MYNSVSRHTFRLHSSSKHLKNAKQSVKSYSTANSNQRAFLDDVGKKFNISDLSDWYKLSLKDFQDFTNKDMLKQHNSLYHLLSSNYPEYDWVPWKFKKQQQDLWNDLSLQKKFIDWSSNELKIKDKSDWYSVSYEDLVEIGGAGILKKYDDSIVKLLSAMYPEYRWLPWKFKRLPNGFWNNENSKKDFMEWVTKELNIKEMSDWHKVSSRALKELGGGNLLGQYEGSLLNLLRDVYPEYNWVPWEFNNAPKKFWEKEENQREFMVMAGKKLNIKEMSDWYKISNKDIIELEGGTLLNRHSSSLYKVLKSVYPEYEWLPWKFEVSPHHFWDSIENQKSFLDWAAKEMKMTEMSDWYNKATKDIIELGGEHLLTKYNGSLQKALSAVYPDYDWAPWKFSRITANSRNENTRKFLDSIAPQLNIKNIDDWYKIKREDLLRFEGGNKLLSLNNTMVKILSSAYPENGWLPWKFDKGNTYWSDLNNCKQFIDWIIKTSNVSDLFQITPQQVIDSGGGSLIVKYGSLSQLLSRLYPDYDLANAPESQTHDIWHKQSLARHFANHLQNQSENEVVHLHRLIRNMDIKERNMLIEVLILVFPQYNWLTKNMSATGKKAQFLLKDQLEKIFKNSILLEEYRHPDVTNLELDYYYPQYKLAFEYQGKQHYHNVSFYNRGEQFSERQKRDQKKLSDCEKLGITLIEIPYWWDRELESLSATIYNVRPDLFEQPPLGKPISKISPKEKTTKKTVAAKQFVNRLFMTATNWNEKAMEPKGWYITEKYDGMRLYWDGSKFFTRGGETIDVPDYISQELPNIALDGEIWTQYGLYQDAVSLGKTTNEEKWRKATYWIFDCPLQSKPLEARIEYMKSLKLPSWAKVVDFVKCRGKEHLEEFMKEVTSKGGEGVVLREPGSLYTPVRSTSLRKYKHFVDTEVRVEKNQYPYGFTCLQANGKTIFVKIVENAHEARLVKAGTVISVKHMGSNVHGTLLHPQFYRERLDLKWSDVNKPL